MSILVWYLVLFAPELVIGTAIGWWAAGRKGGNPAVDDVAATAAAKREQELRLAFDRLKLLTDSVQEDVREHAQKVDTSSKELAGLSADGRPVDANSALEAIAPVVQANAELQRRLQETEQRLAEQAKLLDQQTTEARTDPLTGLLNRRGMENELPELFEAHEQAGKSFCLTILDIDHFKKFNDTYGHDVGDVVLRDVARVVAGAVRRQDVVARFGGEEFVILSPDTDLHEAGLLLEKVRTAVEENLVREAGHDLKVTISLGVAEVREADAGALMKRADLALYAAKKAGRNRAYFHDGEDSQPVVLRGAVKSADGRTDELTRLPSRAAFTEELGRRIAESSRSHSHPSLILLEVDHLARISADHGERMANLVRSGVAAFLQDIMRDMDLVARNDSNGFSILLPGCDLDNAASVADRVRKSVAELPFDSGDVHLKLTLSAGVVTAYPAEATERVMKRAQEALFAARQAGGNRSSVDRPPAESIAFDFDAAEDTVAEAVAAR